MEIIEPADPVKAALPEVERHLRHNFTANLLNSSFLTFAGSLISSGVILPLFVSNLSDSKVLVGLIMTISFAGVTVPQLFATPIIARFPQIKKLLVPSVLIAERLPLLLLGLAIFLAREIRTDSERTPYVLSFINDPASNQKLVIQAGTRCGTAPFIFPTTGMVGYLWDDVFNAGHRHQGDRQAPGANSGGGHAATRQQH